MLYHILQSSITAFSLVVILYFQHLFNRTFSIKLLAQAPNVLLADWCSPSGSEKKKSKPTFQRKPEGGFVLTGKVYYESINVLIISLVSFKPAVIAMTQSLTNLEHLYLGMKQEVAQSLLASLTLPLA